MNVREIDPLNHQDVNKFIQLPFLLYKNDPNWVPPLLSDIRFSLNQETHPFYTHSEASFFLVEDNKQVLGRIAVLDNQRYKAHTKEKSSFFYYFESVNDPQVSCLLFDASFDWSRKRGLNKILGPKGLAQGDGLGLLVEGFEFIPAIGIPYNPPYYVNMVKDAGFIKKVDYLSGYLGTDYQLPAKSKRVLQKDKRDMVFG